MNKKTIAIFYYNIKILEILLSGGLLKINEDKDVAPSNNTSMMVIDIITCMVYLPLLLLSNIFIPAASSLIKRCTTHYPGIVIYVMHIYEYVIHAIDSAFK